MLSASLNKSFLSLSLLFQRKNSSGLQVATVPVNMTSHGPTAHAVTQELANVALIIITCAHLLTKCGDALHLLAVSFQFHQLPNVAPW